MRHRRPQRESPEDQPWELSLRERLATGARVGLSGAGGSGKTTFGWLFTQMYGGRLHDEVAREWLREHEISAYWQMELKAVAQMQLHLLERLERSDANVFDRTAADTLYFARRAAEHIELAAFAGRAETWMTRLDCVVFFPYRAEYVRDDGYRNPAHAYQLKAASAIYNWLIESSIVGRIVVYRHDLDFYANCASVHDVLAQVSTQRTRSDRATAGEQ